MESRFAHRIAVVLALTVMAISPGQQTFAGVPLEYTLTYLGVLPGSQALYPHGINATAQVVGVSNQSGPFLWEDGELTAVGGAVLRDGAYDINDLGQVVGGPGGPPGAGHAYAWETGHLWYLPEPAGLNASTANAINNSGQVVGTVRGPEWWQKPTGAVWMLGGGVTLLDTDTEAYDNNELGEIVGTRSSGSNRQAVLWRDGVMSDLGQLTHAYSINDHGQVVGKAGSQAAMWDNGEFAFLPVPSPRGSTYAMEINNRGEIVGYAGEDQAYAVLWVDRIGYDLNDLVPGHPDFYLRSARAINNSGQIAGWGIDNRLGEVRAFLLTPIPEPATLSLLAFSSLLLLRRRRK